MMKTLLVILLLPLYAFAGEISLVWDPSPSTGVTNYSIHVGTNSLASGNTNWIIKHVGTNLMTKIEVEGSAKLYVHARAWLDGQYSYPSNEIQVQSVAPPGNVRTVAVEATFDIAGTNWIQAGYFRLRFLP